MFCKIRIMIKNPRISLKRIQNTIVSVENNLTLQLEILDKNHLLIDAILMENLNTQELTLSRAKSLH